MPKLQRPDYYDLTRDMNWHFRYVSEDDAFPEIQSKSFGIPFENWWTWDEPYKLTYREYTHNQSNKDVGIFSVRSVTSRGKLWERLDPGWRNAIKLHYGAAPHLEYLATIGEARMARFGRAAAWRNMALFGALDEMRHAQIQLYFPHAFIQKDADVDWALKLYHTNEWAAIVARMLFDNMQTANDATSTSLQLTFAFETGFSNLQFLGMASEALRIGDYEFGALAASIQTDEARHAQQGEASLKVLLANGKRAEAQRLVDMQIWTAWRVFALLTGLSMDYYTPVEHRVMSFKEFMHEWILKQFADQFQDLGLDKPWYWESHLIPEIDWWHHGAHLGVWYWRQTVWYDPAAGVSPADREWLEEKYPGWNARFGEWWDVITHNVREGKRELLYPETLPMLCNVCGFPVISVMNGGEPPRLVEHNGRRYTFCSEPCQWIFEQEPQRRAGHLSLVDRFLAGQILPPTMEGAMLYMGLSPEERGDDARDYAWAFEPATRAAAD